MPSPLICRLSRRTKDSSPPCRLHERAVGALVDQHELVAADLDARVQAGNEVSLDDDVVVLGAPDGDAGALLVDDQFPIVAQRSRSRSRRRPPARVMAIAGTMLVTSSVCHSTS